MSRRSTRRKAAQRRSHRSSRSHFLTGRQLHRQLRLEPLEDRHLLAITVTTLTDTVDLNDGLTSLREAIFAANTVPGADTIDFDPALTANGPGTILLTQGELRITDSLTINGPGQEWLSIRSGSRARILNIDNRDPMLDLDVELCNLAMIGSRVGKTYGAVIFNSENLNLFEVLVEKGYSDLSGGGIYSVNGCVTIESSTIRDNFALDFGGGVYSSEGQLRIVDTEISGNRAANSRGGGIAAIRGDVSISGSALSENLAIGGGAIFHQEGQLSIRQSEISGNSAQSGGGVRIYRSGVDIEDSTIALNRATFGDGGAIRSFQSTLHLEKCEIEGNSAGGGGGIWNYLGSTTLVDTAVSRNSAGREGGGLSSNYGELSITRCTFDQNFAGTYGGGIFSTSTSPTISQSMISENIAGGGGGIFAAGASIFGCQIEQNRATLQPELFSGGGGIVNVGGRLRIESSQLERNSSSASGGGVRLIDGQLIVSQSTIVGNVAALNGGGISSRVAELQIVSSTLSQNVAGAAGGGLETFAWQTQTLIFQSTITENSANNSAGGVVITGGVMSVAHTIVAENDSIANRDLEQSGRAEFQLQKSLLGDRGSTAVRESNGIPDIHGNLIGGPVNGVIDPLLGPLADNGGFELPDGSRILTHALLPGSPAINAGDLNAAAGQGGVPEFDQRGEPFGRIVGGRIDIGAFEYQTPTDLNLLVDTLADESDGDYSRGDLSLREAIELANQNRYAGVIDTVHFDPALTAPGPATILLTQGELKITDSLTINGPGADLLTIDASGNDPTPEVNDRKGSRVFLVDDGIAASLTTNTISGLRLTGGDIYGSGGAIFCTENLTIARSIVTGNAILGDSQGYGGGVFVWRKQGSATPRLVVQGSEISGNVTNRFGGGIAARDAIVELRDSRIENNSGASGGGVSIQRSQASITSVTFSDNKGWRGGGLFTQSGNVELTSSLVRRNTAEKGGGIYSDGSQLMVSASSLRENQATYGNGGAIAGLGITIIGSEIAENTARFNGGGLYGSAIIDRCNFFLNTADDSGGAIFGRGLRVLNSTLSGNLAYGDGGGIGTDMGDLEIVGSIIYGNTADHGGGGIAQNASYGNVAIRSTTIADNNSRIGGGVQLRGSEYTPCVVEFVTIVGNRATVGGGAYLLGSNIDFRNTIIAKNRASLGRDLTGLIGTEFELAHCLIGDNANSGIAEAPIGAPDANGNLIGGSVHGPIDPMLREVWYGPTTDWPDGLTIYLPDASSPAVDAGDPNAVAGVEGIPDYDQRGPLFDRVVGERIDIGAIEVQLWGLLPGDYQRDRVIDARDYTAWRDSLGATLPPGSGADGNADGVVDQLDYDVWRSNFGATVYVQSTLVATPAASFETTSVAKPVAEKPPVVAALRNLAGSRTLSQKLAPPPGHAPQPPALPGVLGGNERTWSQRFVPRDHALAAWFASRRPATLHDAESEIENRLRDNHQDVANSFDAALATLDDDRESARRRALHVLH